MTKTLRGPELEAAAQAALTARAESNGLPVDDDPFALPDEVDALVEALIRTSQAIDNGRPAKKQLERLLPKITTFLNTSTAASKVKFVNDWEIERAPKVEFLVDGIIPRTGFCEMYGTPGAGKSFVALEMALDIATGLSFFDRRVMRADVAYVAAEGSGGLGQRVSAWKDARGLSDRFLGVHFLTEPVALHDPSSVARFIALLATLEEQPGLVVFDTLARCMPGGDENSAKDMGLAVAGIDRVRQQTGGAVLVVHHPNAGGEKARGSTSLPAALDVELVLKKDDDSITLSCQKMKDAPEFDPLRLRLVPRLNSCVVDAAKTTWQEKAAGLTKTQREALAVLSRDFLEDGATLTQWHKATGIPERSFFRVRKDLVADGYVAKGEGRHGRYIVAPQGRTALLLPTAN